MFLLPLNLKYPLLLLTSKSSDCPSLTPSVSLKCYYYFESHDFHSLQFFIVSLHLFLFLYTFSLILMIPMLISFKKNKYDLFPLLFSQNILRITLHGFVNLHFPLPFNIIMNRYLVTQFEDTNDSSYKHSYTPPTVCVTLSNHFTSVLDDLQTICKYRNLDTNPL